MWALARHRANVHGAESVVLVGSSRMQMDIQQAAFAQAVVRRRVGLGHLWQRL
ncbi:MAG: hypothetical protein IH973_01895 [Myxococcales bacterium]|nr:hypothetical protein [Myxococcales bacterium]